MSKSQIKQLIESKVCEDGLTETHIKGVQVFRVTKSHSCVPAVYDPSIIAIVNGSKEAVLYGKKYTYDSNLYMCCSTTLPVEAGAPSATVDDPLLGVSISLDTKVMTELVIELENTSDGAWRTNENERHQSNNFGLAAWSDTFTDALLRLLQLEENSAETTILGEGRLRELYYAVLKGDAGDSAIRAFAVGNKIARSIEYLSSSLNETVTVDELASQAGMSRAAFHRRFKEATTMSPIQFVKSVRLNSAAMKIAAGMNINEAAMNVGYVSSSQFSREFKRMYGQSPKRWSHSTHQPAGVA